MPTIWSSSERAALFATQIPVIGERESVGFVADPLHEVWRARSVAGRWDSYAREKDPLVFLAASFGEADDRNLFLSDVFQPFDGGAQLSEAAINQDEIRPLPGLPWRHIVA